MTVRPIPAVSRASWTSLSLSASNAEVGSSSSSTYRSRGEGRHASRCDTVRLRGVRNLQQPCRVFSKHRAGTKRGKDAAEPVKTKPQ